MKRRQFIRSAMSGGALVLTGRALAGLATSRTAGQSRSADSRIEVLLNEPIGKIAPEIYGHFAEHLGGVVYDGIWVGRTQRFLTSAAFASRWSTRLQRIKPAVMRWPGGCFADSYNWRDGVGPGASVRAAPNFWRDAPEWPKGAPDGPWKYDTNQFGTDEFLRFCQLVGAQPYFAANLRSLTARISTSGLSTAIRLREPRRWLICAQQAGSASRSRCVTGESATNRGAAAAISHRKSMPPSTAGSPNGCRGTESNLAFIGAGPNGGDLDWTRRFFSKLNERRALRANVGLGAASLFVECERRAHDRLAAGKGRRAEVSLSEEWYEMLTRSRSDGIADHRPLGGDGRDSTGSIE